MPIHDYLDNLLFVLPRYFLVFFLVFSMFLAIICCNVVLKRLQILLL